VGFVTSVTYWSDNMSEVPAHFQLFQEPNGDWRWRLRSANNGKIIADSGEGYKKRADCVHGIRLVSQVAPTPYIWDIAKQEYVTA
jgi:uncharacterized protein YegP (UPF0339 family)